MLLPLGPDMVHGAPLRRAPAHSRPPARFDIYSNIKMLTMRMMRRSFCKFSYSMISLFALLDAIISFSFLAGLYSAIPKATENTANSISTPMHFQ